MTGVSRSKSAPSTLRHQRLRRATLRWFGDLLGAVRQRGCLEVACDGVECVGNNECWEGDDRAKGGINILNLFL